ncbi:uncharacterized protein MONBRDRAFT_15305 [Monosiga brevicollis MX1]|uniref:methionine--tRNA ligase n=1 Tax=Monosiga brevicollis TaxID=81824 RepID=A9UU57_MONBE|nr:uncharacterized protein MONBRDRAFT_15305 [Monosiga brevicollis MX1]EDQ91610.1 predicted protein [Monosiga brevicollis MX1]|eukprot:XP_001744032.1 hypothetical protein [Monosiga brevicollis MX1]
MPKVHVRPPAPILPKAGARNILVTSALPYVNNVPHLGNIIGCVLSADVYARFARNQGHTVLFVCGTDEYGTATETKALAEGMTPREICDKYHAIHKGVYEWFNISFDHFGRTSTPLQTEICQDIFKKCYANGFVQQKDEQQWYCTSCETFLADRFVEGICPDCGYDDARGDQCDECGHTFDAIKLKSPRCRYRKDCNKAPELRTSRHLYLQLDKLQPLTEKWYAESNDKHAWSKIAQDISRNWFNMGLEARAITRDLKWGIPVPLEGFTEKVFYVWFDAPIGYISITANYTDQWEQWWKNPENVELFQFMAKDNVPFHSIVFPSALLASQDNWTMLNHLNAVQYLNYEGTQFSKSRGVGVFGDSARDSGLAADVYRFYLLYMRPEASDANFDWEDLVAKHNNELLNNLGNFANRALSFCKRFFDGKVPKIALDDTAVEAVAQVNTELRAYTEGMESQVRIRDAIRGILSVSRIGNQYLQSTMPWKLVKNPETAAQAGSIVGVVLNLTYLIALMLEPIMPDTAQELLQQIGAERRFLPSAFAPLLDEGHVIGEPKPLFEKIDPDMAKEWRSRYGGRQAKAPEAPKVELLPTDRKRKTWSDRCGNRFWHPISFDSLLR